MRSNENLWSLLEELYDMKHERFGRLLCSDAITCTTGMKIPMVPRKKQKPELGLLFHRKPGAVTVVSTAVKVRACENGRGRGEEGRAGAGLQGRCRQIFGQNYGRSKPCRAVNEGKRKRAGTGDGYRSEKREGIRTEPMGGRAAEFRPASPGSVVTSSRHCPRPSAAPPSGGVGGSHSV